MAFKMKVSNDKLEGMDVVPAGQYDIKLVAFNPKPSKKGDSVNLNAIMEITNHPEFAGRKVFDTLNSGGSFTWPDFVHCFGLPMEVIDADNSTIPGDWDGDPAKFKEDDYTTWKYKGPLVGRSGKAEIAVDNYNGKDNNKIRRYFCAVQGCEQKFPKIRHQTDLLRNNK